MLKIKNLLKVKFLFENKPKLHHFNIFSIVNFFNDFVIYFNLSSNQTLYFSIAKKSIIDII